jgi:hypothetical protein
MRLKFATGLAALTASLLIVCSASAQTPPPLPTPLEKALTVPKGVEILGKGPVHEAYARPASDQPLAGSVLAKEPPAPITEVPPDQKPEGSVWVPGYWQWDDERSDYVWVSGVWRVPPPGRQWVTGQYQRVVGGYRWAPGFWSTVPQADVTYLPQPPNSMEGGPYTPQPQDDAFYMPGNWQYQDGSYRWRNGFWSQFRPGWVWVPTQYLQTQRGYVCNDGYWDYPLENRGTLFAAASINPAVVGSGFAYTPNYVVSGDFLPSALFVRSGYPNYFYGDYYRGNGYNFWGDSRYGRSLSDPLFGYYRVANRDRNWERDLRAIQLGRARGDLPLPATTLTGQLSTVAGARPAPLLAFGSTGGALIRVGHTERAFQGTPVRVVESARISTGPTIINGGSVAVTPGFAGTHWGPTIVNGPIHSATVVHSAPIQIAQHHSAAPVFIAPTHTASVMVHSTHFSTGGHMSMGGHGGHGGHR